MTNTKTNYIQTEIGLIPEDWKIVKLSTLANIVRGGSPRPAGDPRYFNGDFIPWLTVGSVTNISESSLYVTKTNSCLTELGSKFSRKIPKGTIILGNSGFSLGVSKILGIDCCANDGIAALLNFDSNTNIEFITYYLNTLTEKLRKVIAIGNDQPNLNTERIGNIFVPFPPTKKEQDLIADVLRNSDNYINHLENLIFKKKDLKKAIINTLFLKNNEEQKYSLFQLEKNNLISISRGKVISKKDIINNEGDYPIYSSSILNNGLFGAYNDYEFNQELITWSIDGGGHFFHRPKHKFSVTNVCGTISVLSDKINCFFLANQLQYLHNKMHFDYTMKAHPSIIRKAYYIDIPPIEEQNRIADILKAIDNEIESLEKKLDKARMLKKGLTYELLLGKKRLI